MLFKSSHLKSRDADITWILAGSGSPAKRSGRSSGGGGKLMSGHQNARGKRIPEKLEKEATIRGSTTDLREKVYVTVPR